MNTTEKPKRVEGTRSYWEYRGASIQHLTSLKGQHKFKWWVFFTSETRKFKTLTEAVAYIDTINSEKLSDV
jgi:hypothetical protein